MSANEHSWPAGDVCGVPLVAYGNVVEALSRVGIECSFDTFTARSFVSGPGLGAQPKLLNADSVSDIRHRLWEQLHIDFGRPLIRDACDYLCRQNSFHAVLDELSKTEWDREERIGRLLERYAGVPHEPYHGSVARRALVAAIRLLRSPGVQVDYSWVLQGPQESGKTSFVRILGGDWYGEGDLLRKNEQQIQEALRLFWLYEIAEAGSLHRADERAVKAIISRRDDGGRRAYGHDFEHQPRHTFLFITTNDAIFLKDRTGNRRFHITPFSKLDRDALERDRAQIWAEAMYLEQNGLSIQVPRKHRAAAEAARESAMQIDPWISILSTIKSDIIGGEQRVSNADVLAHLGISKDRQSIAQLHRAAECMLQLGWERGGPFKIGRHTVRGFKRNAPEGT
ncbi:MAG: VapE domain-containing protein [Hyphomonadaceae bacterium]